ESECEWRAPARRPAPPPAALRPHCLHAVPAVGARIRAPCPGHRPADRDGIHGRVVAPVVATHELDGGAYCDRPDGAPSPSPTPHPPPPSPPPPPPPPPPPSPPPPPGPERAPTPRTPRRTPRLSAHPPRATRTVC